MSDEEENFIGNMSTGDERNTINTTGMHCHHTNINGSY